MFDGKSQETVGDSVDVLSTLPVPLASMLPKMLEPLDGYAGVESFGELNNFCRELPTSSSCVVPLPSAKALELFTSLTSAVSVTMCLKLRSLPLKFCLHPRQVLSKIELLQYFALGTTDGHGNAASVDVHPQHVRTFSLLWIVLSQDGEELEVLTHDRGADGPASSEVSLESSPSSILSDRQTYSFRIDANAQGWITSSCDLDAEKASVESHDHAINLVSSLADSPSTTTRLLYKLGRDTELLTVLAISQVVQFHATFDLPGFDQPEALLNHLEKRVIGFSEFRLFVFGQRERVQNEALLHGYRV